MNKNQLKILETKLDEQKAYIQELESRLNTKSSEIIDTKNILNKTHEQIKELNDQLNHLLDFVLMLEEEKLHDKTYGVLNLQDYMQSILIAEDKNLLFGLNIDKKFIRNRSIATIKYYLYTFDCFIQEEYELQNLRISQKKDFIIVMDALNAYIKLSFKNKKIAIKGIIETLPSQSLFPKSSQNLRIKFYGNQSIEEEVKAFINLYSQKD
ncbi:hypothetical protein [Helicobacter sp. 11S03491-1]|uniref:hypothetical protein n=1 Tax=Helicobacter sp. 11S03491-1 TaxID=1476196 RepID=UPI000BA7C400|nr:hypothetical protein [Helicobacter sp. 11S03491-1]PAF43027.1 hypothetical protein BKH45_02865 [Helicobacter sp. 11S03491-1]